MWLNGPHHTNPKFLSFVLFVFVFWNFFGFPFEFSFGGSLQEQTKRDREMGGFRMHDA